MMRVHGSSVAIAGRGMLITGASGSGKSALALALIGLGADLVSDDQTELRRAGDVLTADAPAAIRGRIEARGVGLLHARPVGPVPLVLAVDLDRREDQRLPPMRHTEFLEISLPLVLGPFASHLPYALRQYLLAGRSA